MNKPLHQDLLDEPHKFDFFQAVRLLERIFPERDAVARTATPQHEVVRFRSNASLKFPPAELYTLIETVNDASEEKKLELYVNFMGLLGSVGVLPIHYTELAIQRARYNDTAMWAFFDIFTHRAVSLFYRAWEKYRFPVQYERGSADFTDYLLGIIGLGTNGLRGRLALGDEDLIPYAGLIAQKPHSKSAVEQILADYFSVSAKIQQFSGQWLSLDKESITLLGNTNSILGASAFVGNRVWDYQSKFRIVFGALKFVEFQSFLPNGSSHQPLLSIIRLMTGEEFDCEVQLLLKADEVPSTILTTRAKRRPMLGWTSFLKSQPFTQDDDQVVLQLKN